MSASSDQSPGDAQRGELATGLLVRGISINGDYILCDQCSVSPTQEIDLEWYAGQGGGYGAIANIGVRKIEGKFTIPLRKKRDGTLESAVVALLTAAQAGSAFRVDTNHVLTHPRLTAEYGGTDNNELLTLTCCVVRELKINVGADSAAKIEVTIDGLIDYRTRSKDEVTPPSDGLAGRAINLTECSVVRFLSAGHTLSTIEFSISNTIEQLIFIPPYYANNRDNTATDTSPIYPMDPRPYSLMADQPGYIGVKQSKWSGKFDEVIRLGLGTESYEHGGWAYRALEGGGVTYSDMMVMQFGPLSVSIPTPLYKVATQDIVPGLFVRSVSFMAQMAPAQGMYFTFNESPD